MYKVDILAIGAHPDDVELCAGGTLLRAIHQGKTVGLLDLTHGELGTNGDGPTRLLEAEEAKKRIGASWRSNLGIADGFFTVSEDNIKAVARYIRLARPQVILANAVSDRHPDHGRAAKLVNDAVFISGLSKVDLRNDDGEIIERWRPKIVLNYLQDMHLAPNVVVDITPYQEQKMEVIRAYASQFFGIKTILRLPSVVKTFGHFWKQEPEKWVVQVVLFWEKGLLVCCLRSLMTSLMCFLRLNFSLYLNRS